MNHAWRECPTCDAEGKLDVRCGMCGGSGEGYADGSTCQHCRGGYHAEACADCDGLGRLPVDCAEAEAERIAEEIRDEI